MVAQTYLFVVACGIKLACESIWLHQEEQAEKTVVINRVDFAKSASISTSTSLKTVYKQPNICDHPQQSH